MTENERPRLPWFTTKGQIAQLALAALACVFSGIKAWPEMRENEFFSSGALLFYALVALVVLSFGLLLWNLRRAKTVRTYPDPSPSIPLPPPTPPSPPPLSAVEVRVRSRLDNDFRGLTWPQKVLLRRLYDQQETTVAQLATDAAAFHDFAHAAAHVDALLHTDFVSVRGERIAPNPATAEVIESFLAEARL